jgi:lysophospholipase L1-like esterase
MHLPYVVLVMLKVIRIFRRGGGLGAISGRLHGSVLLCSVLLVAWAAATGCGSDDDKKSDPPPPVEEPDADSSTPNGDDDPPPAAEPPTILATNPPPILAMGDSITTGEQLPDAAPYPARVAEIKARQVINAGRGGERACSGAKRMLANLSFHPDVVMILYGSNDVIGGWNLEESKECLRTMVQQCISLAAQPVLATIPPMIGPATNHMPRVEQMNELIRTLATEEGVPLVDLAAEFGAGESLLLPDGIHPNEAGTQIIAFSFSEAF